MDKLQNKLQHYLNQFKNGKLAVQVKGYVDHENLMQILSKYNVPVVYQTDIEASFYISHPYLWVDNGLICGNKDMSYCTRNSGITEYIDADELNHLDMLQDFENSKLVVQVDNSFQSEKLIDYLRKNGVAIHSATDYTSNPSRFPYFYMLRPTELTAGESFKAIENYVHIHKVVSFDVFVSEALLNFNLKDFTSGQTVMRINDGNEYEQFIRYLQKHGIEDESFPVNASSYDEDYPFFFMRNENGSSELNAGVSAALITETYGHKCVLNYSDFDFTEELQETIKETDRNDLAAFTSGRLTVHINNSMEHRLFLDYLKEHGLSGKLYPDIKQYDKNNAYFYMYKGKMSGDMLLTAIRDVNAYFREHHKEMSVKEFCNVDFISNTKPKAIEESVPLSLYEQVKAERNQAFAQLNALGVSFGEDPKLAQKRIEDTVIDHILSAIKEKSTALCNMVRKHYGTPNDIVQDFIENISSIIDSVRDDLDNDITAERDLEQDEREL